ncbi:hypothetical protein [Rathayibacter sp. VKM Ac-2801]|uniref:hypothetical protein n=1 Tax=Rathayibacter sp. VKM Ac-2801 TaxID=2609255 RepID=UPI001320210D|nr:hypothetical protein [Rathayibacter sp. VKM Ac-2801]QHC69686.1 hypothetical protein GSU45_04370 [Rathayibacter sp. VKM Ac-2801]
MAGPQTTRALEELIAALAAPGAIHPALARRVAEDARLLLRPTEHRRVPTAVLPLAAFTVIADEATMSDAHL